MATRHLLAAFTLATAACGDSARDRYRDTSGIEQVPNQQYYPSDAPAYASAAPPQYAAPAAPAYQAPPVQPAQVQPAYQSAPAPQRRAVANSPRQVAAVEPVSPPSPRVLLSAGTTLFVSPRADICSSEQSVGARFSGYVVESSNGAPVGNVTFEVTDASKAGGVHEQPRLRVTPVEYERDGEVYPLSADVIEFPTNERRLQGDGRRDARNAVVGAAVGAIAGQLLGRNTKSTVAGAAAGAAVGGAGSYTTADRDLCLGVGTRIGLSVRSSVVQ